MTIADSDAYDPPATLALSREDEGMRFVYAPIRRSGDAWCIAYDEIDEDRETARALAQRTKLFQPRWHCNHPVVHIGLIQVRVLL
jgi:hypothetical protein